MSFRVPAPERFIVGDRYFCMKKKQSAVMGTWGKAIANAEVGYICIQYFHSGGY